MTNSYRPEGYLFGTRENRDYISSKAGLERAMDEGRILEASVMLCDSRMRLHVDLYGITGIIDKSEAVYSHDSRAVKEIAIITRVGKPVCFKVMGFAVEDGREVAILSRREAQKECASFYLSDVIEGDIVEAKVTHLDNFGAFVDIGCGIVSLLSIDCISVSRISHPSDRLSVGDKIFTVIKSIDRHSGRIFVSMRELLGTWEQNAREFEVGQTVAGIVRSIEPYGVFVELSPNLAGLAELKDGSDGDIAHVGEYAAVYIKSILPDKMKVKLVLIDSYHGDIPQQRLKYYIDCNEVTHINKWRYSPPSASKIIETVF
ncbi:MAG: S1 RNA-binding domain-containing protein [Ruminococcaceae bacterium]|nr:S1 RNA-binding domain-containing protein [Oscillospiraceae bacterium]